MSDFLFPAHGVQTYFQLFGKTGFHEYQVIIAYEHFDELVDALRRGLLDAPATITLCSAKLFNGRPELLRCTGEGICRALNFPRDSQGPALLAFLDELTVRMRGIPNLIKDSRLPRAVVEATHPEIDQFRERLAEYDLKRRFHSELSERLAL